jgi:hypothetical protein
MIGTWNADHQIIAAVPNTAMHGRWIVVGAAPRGERIDYVTWETDGTGSNYYWGNPSSDMRTAIADMMERAHLV